MIVKLTNKIQCNGKKYNCSEEIEGRERKGEEPKGGGDKDRLNTNLNPTHWMNYLRLVGPHILTISPFLRESVTAVSRLNINYYSYSPLVKDFNNQQQPATILCPTQRNVVEGKDKINCCKFIDNSSSIIP